MDSMTAEAAPTIAPCPVCGAYTGDGITLTSPSALLAVCDVLVVKTLEVVGKRIVRNGSRDRFARMNGRPWHLAHTLWAPDDSMIEKSLRGAWDVVPAMLDSHGCCGVTSRQVVNMLDAYVRDLLLTGTLHNLTDLRYRFESRLGVPLPEPTPYVPHVAQ